MPLYPLSAMSRYAVRLSLRSQALADATAAARAISEE